MKPLHTNRMMFRSMDQEILAPLVVVTRANQTGYSPPSVMIRNLDTRQLTNQHFSLGGVPQYPSTLSPSGLNFHSPPENVIRLPNLIHLHRFDQPKALKTIILADMVTIQEAQLSNSFSDNRFIIGIGLNMNNPQAPAASQFDLAHENYLLRFAPSKEGPMEQLVSGTTVVSSYANFHAGLEAQSVNQIGDFARFVQETIVRVDRPAIINGPVQFNAISPLLFGPAGQPPFQSANSLLLHVHQGLQVGLVNGMRLPFDIVLLPSKFSPPNANVLQPNQVVNVYGPRRFVGRLSVNDFVFVQGLVNGMKLPETVIPLHLNDFISSVGYSNLIFVDGVDLEQLIIQGGRFDEILLRDVYVDAQSLVMNSVFPRQPDGSILIRAPLRVMNLNLFGGSAMNHGLLNGFRPQELLELSRYPIEVLHGRKRFLAPIEANECIFNNINNLSHWPSQLIRIDRPNTVQTVQSRLAFGYNQLPFNQFNTSMIQLNATRDYGANQTAPSRSLINVDHLEVEFQPETNQANYVSNWNLSPEFYLMHQALARHEAGVNQTGGRYRCQKLVLQGPHPMVNNIALHDIVTLNQPFKFGKQFTFVGKVELAQTSLRANRIQSNYPIDMLDLVQFNSQRIPVFGSRQPIRLNNLVLGPRNQAAFVQSRLLNGISLNEFANSIMSLTRPQRVESELVFNSPVSFEGPFRTSSSLNGIKQFHQFAARLRQAKYQFEDGLQCNAVLIRT